MDDTDRQVTLFGRWVGYAATEADVPPEAGTLAGWNATVERIAGAEDLSGERIARALRGARAEWEAETNLRGLLWRAERAERQLQEAKMVLEMIRRVLGDTRRDDEDDD